MQVGYFTERPYRWLPEEEVLKNGGFFGVSNRLYDREKAADYYGKVVSLAQNADTERPETAEAKAFLSK